MNTDLSTRQTTHYSMLQSIYDQETKITQELFKTVTPWFIGIMGFQHNIQTHYQKEQERTVNY